MAASPTVVLTARITEASGYVEPRDSISHDWIRLLDGLGMRPVVLPNALSDVSGYLDSLEPRLLILTGGDDLGSTPLRDGVEIALFDRALTSGIPVLGVCRGLQLVSVHLGGKLTRIEGHVGAGHSVKIGDPFDSVYGTEASVNSYHALAIPSGGLASGLMPWAWDEDGHVEGAVDPARPFVGVMWHPERHGALAADRQLLVRLVEDGAFWL